MAQWYPSAENTPFLFVSSAYLDFVFCRNCFPSAEFIFTNREQRDEPVSARHIVTQQCKFLQPDVGKLLWKFRSFSIANDKKAPTQCNDMSSGVQEILLHCEVRAVIVFYHLCTHREINICGHIGLSVLICIFQPPI